MALPASDTFTGVDGALIQSRTGWANVRADLSINSNHARTDESGGGICAARWSGDAFANDQKASADVTSGTSNFKKHGPIVRCASGAVSFYWYYGRGDYNTSDLVKVIAGVQTLINAGVLHTGTHSYEIRVAGTTISTLFDGVTDADIGDQTDSALASGSAGIAGEGTTTTSSYLDNWTADNNGGGPPAGIAIPILMAQYRQRR